MKSPNATTVAPATAASGTTTTHNPKIFSNTTRRRVIGFASRKSSVPSACSPASVRAPYAMAATTRSAGMMSEKSSTFRYPAPVLKSNDAAPPKKAFSSFG